jgi:hypothetical protein
MKTVQPPLDCTVQSVTDPTGRRTLKFRRNAPDTGLAQVPVKRRKSPFRLKLLMVPESEFSFEPLIQVRSRAKF